MIDIAKARERVAEEHLRLDVFGIGGEDPFRARLGVVEAARREQVIAGRHLHRAIVGHEIGRADELAQRPAVVLGLFQGAGEAEPRRAGEPVDLHRVAVLDRGFTELAVLEILVAARDEALFSRLGTP